LAVGNDGVGRRTQDEATQRFLADATANGMVATVGGLIKADLAIFCAVRHRNSGTRD
jgi:hypothetical protein